MTNDEKAKAYDMALEAARKELGVDRKEWKVVEHVLRNIFPELRESEDERIRKAALEGIEYLERKLGWDAIGDTDILDVKEYLEKQKEQKPAEWSEEDADILNCCISSIEEAKENRYAYKETDGDTSYDREIVWLKSLRPSWKPSEEQMKQLHYALTPGSAFDCDILNELYRQLEKLK